MISEVLSRIPEEIQGRLSGLLGLGFEFYIVGGFVRDTLFGIDTDDIDIATNAPKELLLPVLPYNTRFLERYQTVFFNSSGYTCEITRFRRDFGYNGRHCKTELVSTIEEDLPRRDFTVNAMAVSLRDGSFIDIFNGKKDLEQRILRTIGEPHVRFSEDAFRIMKGASLSLKLDMIIEENTLNGMRKMAAGLNLLRGELIKRELIRMLSLSDREKVSQILLDTNIAASLFPFSGINDKWIVSLPEISGYHENPQEAVVKLLKNLFRESLKDQTVREKFKETLMRLEFNKKTVERQIQGLKR